jgi:hypothetical protein
MSLAQTLFGLRQGSPTIEQVADAIDFAYNGQNSNSVVTATGSIAPDASGCIFVNNSSNITLTLPAPSTCQGKVFKLVKISDNANTCTIATAAGSIFASQTNVIRARNDQRTYVSNGANYIMIGADGSDWISYTPSISAGSPMTVSDVTFQRAQYKLLGDRVDLRIQFNATLGGTASFAVFCPLPSGVTSAAIFPLSCVYSQPLDGGMVSGNGSFAFSDRIDIRKPDASNFTVASTIRVIITGHFFITV